MLESTVAKHRKERWFWAVVLVIALFLSFFLQKYIPVASKCGPVSKLGFALATSATGGVLGGLVASMFGPRYKLVARHKIFIAASIITSLYFLIYSFAILYASAGIVPSEGLVFGDYFYFSTVTFTTLGYGDFKPCAEVRMYSAMQGFLGFFMTPILIVVLLRAVTFGHDE